MKFEDTKLFNALTILGWDKKVIEYIKLGKQNKYKEEDWHLNMTIKVLKEQVAIFTSRLEPHDTGHIHTTISTLKHRIGELEKERK